VTPDLQKGTELAGRYTLLRRLGTGAHTQTWLASDRMTRASVALKICSSDKLSAAGMRSEWQTSLRLMHANIVRAFEFHDQPDLTFFSLQYVDGADAAVLSGAPPSDILPAMALIADALRYVHGKGLVHHDIKASNILLDRSGVPYLSDFGTAVAVQGTAAGGSQIAASPQSLAGEAAAAADDIFALGGLIYELIAGRSAYSSAHTAEDIQHRQPAPLTASSGEPLSPAVQELVANMMAKEASARPDAAAVVQRLADAGFRGAPVPPSYVSGGTLKGPEIIAAQKTERASRRPVATATVAPGTRTGISSRVMGAGLAILMLLLIGVVFVLPRLVSTPATTLPPAAAYSASDESGEAPVTADDGAKQSGPLPARDARVVARAETDAVLGQLLSRMQTLESRAVQRWGGLRFKQAQQIYSAGDAAYLERDYATAIDRYREALQAIEPLLDEVDAIFAKTYTEAEAALEAANTVDALRLFELAVAMSPGDAGAQAGLQRARNLDSVLSLTEQGLRYERDLELAAARQNFERATDIDPQWQPAKEGLARVVEAMRQRDFATRMTEGLAAIADGQYDAARAAFRMAQALDPASREPADGLLQVEQELRLDQIRGLEQRAVEEKEREAWESVASIYEQILEIDDTLEFAQQGLLAARQMTQLHAQLDTYIADPDALSSPVTMQKATALVVDITRMSSIGPRLADQRDELSRLLKRAATPIRVQLVSDNQTDVSVYKVAKLGSFTSHELNLRPGKYVAVGSRPGFRDVRVEFQVGPEIEARSIAVRCEEAI